MTTSRGLVLGGGGVTGFAWEIGLLAGLAERGVQLRDADLVVGTSAGSAVASQLLAGVDLEKLYESQLGRGGTEIVDRLSPWLIARYAGIMLTTRNQIRAGARFGKLALAARTVSEAERRAALAGRVPVGDWPEQRLLITAIDAASGVFRAFDQSDGVPLIDAVGASCAVPGVWPPVTIDGRRYIDGGMRSATNADLAAGCDTIVILAPVARGGGAITPLATHVTALRAHATVVAVSPDVAARQAAGRNPLDPRRRAASARAGHAQATTVADAVAGAWG